MTTVQGQPEPVVTVTCTWPPLCPNDPKEGFREYAQDAGAWVSVTTQDARPSPSVVPAHDCVPSENVSVRPGLATSNGTNNPPRIAAAGSSSAVANPVSRRDDRTPWRDPQSGYVRRNISPANFPSPIQ